MNHVYRRFFRVLTGPLMDAISHANEVNKEARNRYLEILKDIGAQPRYYQRDKKLTGILFDENPDPKVFKSLGRFGWYPKRNCAKGREIHKRLSAVETINPDSALETIGLSTFPVMFYGGKCYYATLTIIPQTPPVAYVGIPWADEDPEELARYEMDRATGRRGDRSLDHLLWKPLDGMEEVKEWEVQKHISEWIERVEKGES